MANDRKTADYFRQRAQELLVRAEAAASPRARQIYIELAASWFELAQRTEQLEKGEQ